MSSQIRHLPKETSELIITKLNEGYRLDKAGNFNEAELCYLEVWRMIPDPKYDWGHSMSFLSSISEFYLRSKRYEQAQYWLLETFKTCKSNYETHIDLLAARIYRAAGQPEKALPYIWHAYEVRGERAFTDGNRHLLEILRNPGKEVTQEDGNRGELPAELSAAIIAKEEEGQSLQKKGNFDAAEACFLEVWRMVPEPKHRWVNSTAILSAITEFYLKAEKSGQAKIWLREALEAGKFHHDMDLDLLAARVYFEAGQTAKALPFLSHNQAEQERVFAEDRLPSMVPPPQAADWTQILLPLNPTKMDEYRNELIAEEPSGPRNN